MEKVFLPGDDAPCRDAKTTKSSKEKFINEMK